MHYTTIISLIKERRKLLDINQEELADMADIGLRTLKSIESGKANPTLSTLTKILDILGLELSIKTKK